MRKNVFLFAAGIVVGFGVSPLGRMVLDAASETTSAVKARNTSIIDTQSASAAVLTANTDLLLTCAHWIDRHSPAGEVLCPVCSADDHPSIDWPIRPKTPDVPVMLPDTIEQLAKDSDEIHAGAESTLFSLMIQQQTLRRFVNTLRRAK